jgi:beta-lactamase class A
MSLQALGHATVTQSDNTAVDLIIKELGGIDAITAFARSIQDEAFRLNRLEPEMNHVAWGDERDSSTPKAMAISLKKIVTTDALPKPQQDLMISWLLQSTTGDNRIRAGVPKEWRVGDKTGSCGVYGIANDVAVIWPPNGKPIFLAVYFMGNQPSAPRKDEVVAYAAKEAVRLVAS